MPHQISSTHAKDAQFPEILDPNSNPKISHQARVCTKAPAKAQQKQAQSKHAKDSRTSKDNTLSTQNNSAPAVSGRIVQHRPTVEPKVDYKALKKAICLTMSEQDEAVYLARLEPHHKSDGDELARTGRQIERVRQSRRKRAREYTPNASDEEKGQDMKFGPPRRKPTSIESPPRSPTPEGWMARENEAYAALHPASPPPPPPPEAFSHTRVNEQQATAQKMEEPKPSFPIKVIAQFTTAPIKKSVHELIFSIDQINDFDLLKKIIASYFSNHVKQFMVDELELDILISKIQVIAVDKQGVRRDVIRAINNSATYNCVLKFLCCMRARSANMCCCGVCEGAAKIPEIVVQIRYLAGISVHRTIRQTARARQTPRDPEFIITYDQISETDNDALLYSHTDAAAPQVCVNAHALQMMISEVKSARVVQKELANVTKKHERGQRMIEGLNEEIFRLEKDYANLEKDSVRLKKDNARLKKNDARAQKQILDLQKQLAAATITDKSQYSVGQDTPERPSVSPLTTPVVSDDAKSPDSDESIRDGKRRKITKKVARAAKRAKSEQRTRAHEEDDVEVEEEKEDQTPAPVVEEPDPWLVHQLQFMSERRPRQRG